MAVGCLRGVLQAVSKQQRRERGRDPAMERKGWLRMWSSKAGGSWSLLAACCLVVLYMNMEIPQGRASVGLQSSESVAGVVNSGIPGTQLDREGSKRQSLFKDEAVDLQDKEWEKQEDSIHVRLKTVGVGAFLFIQMAAYRAGTNTFAVVGMGPKSLHDYGSPGFECEWVSSDRSTVKATNVTKYTPDLGLSHQYKAIVVNCTFGVDVGTDQDGGELIVVANHGSSDDTGLPDARFVALKERPGEYNALLWRHNAVYPYDYVYCGSPLFGNLNPQRIREWIAYHAWFFGNRTLFLMYDAGGVEGEVRHILNPWIKVGRVKIVNVRQQERFDGHYHSQFVTLNDCIFRARTLAKWAFIFDVDEYVITAKERTLTQAMEEISRENTQIIFAQKPMSVNLCKNKSLEVGRSRTKSLIASQWFVEKLVYRHLNLTHGEGHFNCKYAIQPKYVLVGGVHEAGAFIGNMRWDDWLLKYYHYHNTVTQQTEPCTRFVNSGNSTVLIDDRYYELDSSVADVLENVREYELQQIGPQSFIL